LKFRRLINLTICSFGIQFGSALQMANMSSIYKFLGADASHLTYLWLAGPVTGLLVQPIIGQMSDKSRSRFGKRRSYMLLMAILAFVSLILMPNSNALWMAAALLWLLDTSNNGVTLPFRALIAEQSTGKGRTRAFAYQAFFSGAGATIAALLPWLLLHLFNVDPRVTAHHAIPDAIKGAFYIGAFAFLLATAWTVFTTKEKPGEPLPEEEKLPLWESFKASTASLFENIRNMPECIREFYSVQLFTWIGLFCMWLYFAIGVAQNVYGLPAGVKVAGHPNMAYLLEQGTAWAGICFATYQFVSFIYALFLPRIAKKIGLKATHAVSLLFGGVGLLAAGQIHSGPLMLVAMIGVGMTWGSIMTMPYTILSLQLPEEKMGIYLGLFNITITVPQIIAAFILAPLVHNFFHDHAMSLIQFGGTSLVIAAALMWFRRKPRLQLS
jgi:maltose/moltooligosaccharide transporter